LGWLPTPRPWHSVQGPGSCSRDRSRTSPNHSRRIGHGAHDGNALAKRALQSRSRDAGRDRQHTSCTSRGQCSARVGNITGLHCNNSALGLHDGIGYDDAGKERCELVASIGDAFDYSDLGRFGPTSVEQSP
jgi:hypothetical protein